MFLRTSILLGDIQNSDPSQLSQTEHR